MADKTASANKTEGARGRTEGVKSLFLTYGRLRQRRACGVKSCFLHETARGTFFTSFTCRAVNPDLSGDRGGQIFILDLRTPETKGHPIEL